MLILGIVVWLLVGIFFGWLVHNFVSRYHPQLSRYLAAGALGGLIGGLIFHWWRGEFDFIGSGLTAGIGALILLIALRLLDQPDQAVDGVEDADLLHVDAESPATNVPDHEKPTPAHVDAAVPQAQHQDVRDSDVEHATFSGSTAASSMRDPNTKLREPDITIPDVDVSDEETPEDTTKMGEPKAEVTMPNMAIPHVHLPEAEVPAEKRPRPERTEPGAPAAKAAETAAPNAPDVRIPDVELPQVELPEAKAAIETPETSSVAPADAEGGAADGVIVDGYPDDLTKIKGIGKVYEKRLREVGVFTWTQIAEAEPQLLKDWTNALDAANVENWPLQARELAEKNDRLHAHYRGPVPDDLTKIAGIGPFMQHQLYMKGIVTYDQLAAVDESLLDELMPKNKRNDDLDPAFWIQQARELANPV